MKYSKKKIRKNKKIFTKQKKKKYLKKKTKKIKKKYLGGAAEEPSGAASQNPNNQLLAEIMQNQPPASTPPLMLLPSGTGLDEAKENLQRLFSFLEENPECKTFTNCVPTATDVISDRGLDPKVLKKWILAIEPEPGTTNTAFATTGTNPIPYLRNFSARYPLESETGDQMWTDEPLIDFLSNLIKTGIHRKENYDPTNPNHISRSGCIHINLNKPYPNPGHSLLFCLDGDKNFIIDVQLSYFATEKVDPRKAIIGPDRNQLLAYFRKFSPNSFSVNTRQSNKSSHIQDILQKRLESVSINYKLNNKQGVNKKLNLNNISNLPARLESALSDMAPITPPILADPFSSNWMSIPPDLVPLIFNFTDPGTWPDNVMLQASKYSKFQGNQYQPAIRKAALIAILKGETNNLLDQLIYLESQNASEPTPTQVPLPPPPAPPPPQPTPPLERQGTRDLTDERGTQDLTDELETPPPPTSLLERQGTRDLTDEYERNT